MKYSPNTLYILLLLIIIGGCKSSTSPEAEKEEPAIKLTDSLDFFRVQFGDTVAIFHETNLEDSTIITGISYLKGDTIGWFEYKKSGQFVQTKGYPFVAFLEDSNRVRNGLVKVGEDVGVRFFIIQQDTPLIKAKITIELGLLKSSIESHFTKVFNYAQYSGFLVTPIKSGKYQLCVNVTYYTDIDAISSRALIDTFTIQDNPDIFIDSTSIPDVIQVLPKTSTTDE